MSGSGEGRGAAGSERRIAPLALDLALITASACRSAEPSSAPPPEPRAPAADALGDPIPHPIPPPAEPTRLSGQVTDASGAPLAGCEFRVDNLDSTETHFPPSATTGADGSFVLVGVKPGRVALWVWDSKLGESAPLVLVVQREERRDGIVLGY